MNPIQIAVTNESTVVTNEEAAKVTAALQRQVSEHYAPIWGTDAALSLVLSGQRPFDANDWQLIILDDSDQAGALGYHDLTKEGLPLGKVFAKTDKTYGTQWSVSASHELLEMLGDPWINLSAMSDWNNRQLLIAYENCDPCESDADGYQIDGVLVSDFVFPSWFTERTKGPYDYRGLIEQALSVRPGGYIQTLDLSATRGWVQNFGDFATGRIPSMNEGFDKREYKSRAQIGSRRERRRIPRHHWQASTR